MPTFRLISPLILPLILGLVVSASAGAHEFKAGPLLIGHPWSRATAPGATIGGGYLTVTNKGSESDRLVSVAVPFAAKVEIHESSVEEGVAKMRQIEGGIDVPAGKTVELAPNGKHLMFVGLTGALRKGEKVEGELVFEKAGKVEVEFAVEAAGSKPATSMDHGGMEGMDHKGH